MAIETVPGTELKYYLIAFDAKGNERTDDPDGLMSQRALDALANEPITDVFIMSHGWKGDVPAAREQYHNWIGAMARCTEDRQRIRAARPGFRALLIGLHWPSQPWGDEELGSAPVAFSTPAAIPAPAAASPIEELINVYAARIADTPTARQALRTIFTAAMSNITPATLPPEVRQAYEVLNQEAELGSEGEAAAPGADREPFDPEFSYQAAKEEAVSFGGIGMGGLLSPLRQLSFWKMKDLARQFGESGGFELLAKLQQASGDHVRFHLMGHSFGCIVVSATLGGPQGHGTLVRPVDTVALVQGALSIWSYASDILPAAGKPGYFRSVIAGHKVRGPIITTQSELDTAVGRFYPTGAGLRRQVNFVPGEWPKYGALGAYGARGPGLELVDLKMLPVDGQYPFEPGKVYNLDSSQYINQGGGASGAHSDIAKPEVAHAFWEAARPRS